MVEKIFNNYTAGKFNLKAFWNEFNDLVILHLRETNLRITRKLSKPKSFKFINILKIIFQSQFVIVFVHSAQVLIYNCGYPRLIALFLLLHSTIFFILFGNFYVQAYKLKKKPLTKAQ